MTIRRLALEGLAQVEPERLLAPEPDRFRLLEMTVANSSGEARMVQVYRPDSSRTLLMALPLGVGGSARWVSGPDNEVAIVGSIGLGGVDGCMWQMVLKDMSGGGLHSVLGIAPFSLSIRSMPLDALSPTWVEAEWTEGVVFLRLVSHDMWPAAKAEEIVREVERLRRAFDFS